jgi:hypothetical protein
VGIDDGWGISRNKGTIRLEEQDPKKLMKLVEEINRLLKP